MQVTHITMFYRRQAQPAQYEAEEVRLEGSVIVGEEDDFEATAYDMLARARVQAHRVLGIKVPTVAEFSPAFEDGGFRADPGSTIPEDKPKPKRTRRTRAQIEADNAAAAAAVEAQAPTAQAAAEDFDIGDAPAESPGGDADFDITGEDKPAEEIETTTLQAECAATSRRLGADGLRLVKGLMAEFEAPQLSKIPQEKRPAFLARLKNLKAAS